MTDTSVIDLLGRIILFALPGLVIGAILGGVIGGIVNRRLVTRSASAA